MNDQERQSEEYRLDLLDARAEEVEQQLGSIKSSESSFKSSEAESEESDAELALEAAVVPASAAARQRGGKQNGLMRQESLKRKRDAANSINDEEDDTVLRTASWRDMEEARQFLTEEHMETLAGLISRWEHENADEGDDVDLSTELIVRSTGHLQALAPQTDLALFDELGDDDEEESSSDTEDKEIYGDNGMGLDPVHTVCEKPALLLNAVIEMSRKRWIL